MELRIATSSPLPEPDPDEVPLRMALAERGVRARLVPWNDPSEPWSSAIPTLLRSTWDYHLKLGEFLAWIGRVSRAAPLWNPPDVVVPNAHKSYLRDLERAGIAIVPTAFLPRGSGARLADVMAARGWSDVVVKPAVSAASHGTLRVRAGEEDRGEGHLSALLREGDALVQGYVAEVERTGERALVWVDGQLTHSVRKTPRFSDHEERVSEALPIAADEREYALRALAHVSDRILYARVDVVRDERGSLMLMELELIEPSLFLVQHPPALERLVAGVVRRLEAWPAEARGQGPGVRPRP